jgi:biotin transport system substrate-specific component
VTQPLAAKLRKTSGELAKMANTVLSDHLWQTEGTALAVKRVALVVAGVAILAVASKIAFPVPPSPVPVTLGTFAVLSLGAAYGPRLGLVTILCYMLIGVLGFDVFAKTSSDAFGVVQVAHMLGIDMAASKPEAKVGITYMMGTTGGYLVGYVLATLALGLAAAKGWDRNPIRMAGAMLIGNALIYVPGLAWLYILIKDGLFDATKYASEIDQTLVWGITPYLIADAMKLALAAVLFPLLWKLVGNART